MPLRTCNDEVGEDEIGLVFAPGVQHTMRRNLAARRIMRRKPMVSVSTMLLLLANYSS